MKQLKLFLVTFIFLVLLLPFLNQSFPFYKLEKLNGFFNDNPDATFTWDGWFNSDYQKQKETYLNNHCGFRERLVRFNGQMDFSLYRKDDYGIIISNDNNLYYGAYIDSYNGVDYVGYDSIKQKMIKIKALQDTFAKLGKTVIVVYAANKAYYFNERDLNRQICYKEGKTNLPDFEHLGDSLGVNQINFNSWFLSLRGKLKDSIFTKQGIHWTIFSSYLVADSILHYVENKRNIKTPHPYWDNIVHTNKPRDTDKDIADVLNIMFPFSSETYSYPDVKYTNTKDQTKPNFVFIGDSFSQSLMFDGVLDSVCSYWEIWFRNNDVFKKSPNYWATVPTNQHDCQGALKNSDVIFIFATTPNLANFGYGFIESEYAYFFGKK